MGNPLLEAMMAGKCIVTLNNGDTSQFIKNNENGILLEYDQLSKLPEVIIYYFRILVLEICWELMLENLL